MRKLIQTKSTTLSYGISDVATTIQLDELLKLDGTPISASDIGDVLYGTFDPGTASEEIFSINGSNVTVNGTDGTVVITGVVRGLKEVEPYGTGGFKTAHVAGSVVVFGNNPQVFAQMAFLANDNVFTGKNTVPTPANPTEIANKDYVDNTVATGASIASTNTLGVSRISKSPNVTLGTATITIASPAVITLNNHGLTANDIVQFTTTGALPTGIVASTNYYVLSTDLTTNTFKISDSLGGTAITTTGSQSGTHTLIKATPIALGANDDRLANIPAGYAADSVGTDSYAITPTPAETSYVIGKHYTFKAGTANTGTCSLNVSGLGAKTIKKNVTDDLSTGDILANQIVEVVYDGTNMIIVSNMPLINGLNSISLSAGEDIIAGNAVAISSGTENGPALVIGTADSSASSNYLCQIFVPTLGGLGVSVVLEEYYSDTGNSTYTMDIYAVSGDLPTGPSLWNGSSTTATGNWTFTPTTFSFIPGTKYALVFHRVSGLDYAGRSNSNTYPSGKFYTSSDGVTWSENASSDLALTIILKNGFSGKIYKTNASLNSSTPTELSNNFIGFATENISYNSTGKIITNGVVTTLSSLTPGSTYYLSNTTGAISTSAGTVSKKIGLAISSSSIIIKHDNS